MTIKQVIVMRDDLNMRKGKMVAQGAHASMGAILNLGHTSEIEHDEEPSSSRMFEIFLDDYPDVWEWLRGSFTKICVRVSSEEQLKAIYQQAVDAGLPCSLITDSGKTEFNGVPTMTCCAIGPARAEDLDPITGELKLL